MEAEIEVAEAMRNYARALEESRDPDVVIAAAQWEKKVLEELERLEKERSRQSRKVGAS